MQVVLTLDAGGTERLVIEIVKKLGRWVDFSVCCLDRAGNWASELTALGVPVVVLKRATGFQPTLGYGIARAAAANRVDVLHCHHYSPFVYGQIAALVHRPLRVVFTEHGRLSDAEPSRKRRLVNPLLRSLPAAVFAVSSDLRRHMTEEGFAASGVQVLHNGIDPGRRPTLVDHVAARRALDLSPSARIVGAVGRLDPVKDLTTLVEAFAEVRRDDADALLAIIGDGPARTAILERARALGVDGDVRLPGYRADVRRLLPAFDVYANSSIHEGVSLTILEAMAAALPVVATAVGGTPEVVLDRRSGFLVPGRAPAALAAALRSVLNDPERAHAMGEAGRFRVKRHFSIDAMAFGYLAAYRRAVGI